MKGHVKALLTAAEAAGYEVRPGRQQVMLRHDGRKVGGWNTKHDHWYVSRVIAGDHEDLMERNGFRWMTKTGGHCWWQLDGEDDADSFRNVVEALTGVRFRR